MWGKTRVLSTELPDWEFDPGKGTLLRGAPTRTKRKRELLDTLVKIAELLMGVCISISFKLLHLICLPRLCAYISSLAC